MASRPVTAQLLLACFVLSLSAPTLARVNTVRGSELVDTITICADGSVSPAEAPILRLGETYLLINDTSSSIVVGRDNVIVDGNSYTMLGADDRWGVDLSNRRNVTLLNMHIEGFDAGIYMNKSSGNLILNSHVLYCKRYGVRLWFSPENRITNNVFEGSPFAVNLGYSSDNHVLNNGLSGGLFGIWVAYSYRNRFVGNTFEDNVRGIYFDYSFNNHIYLNTFENNIVHFSHLPHPLPNFWDNGYPDGGNYWDNYNGSDSNSDGIGDTPYVITSGNAYANNSDRYPLMGKYRSFETSYGQAVTTISDAEITHFNFNLTSVEPPKASATFRLSCSAAGFCRICIPKSLINGFYRVFYDSLQIFPPQLRELDFSNETHHYFYVDFACSTSQHELAVEGTTPIPEASAVFLLMFFVAAAIWTLKARGKK